VVLVEVVQARLDLTEDRQVMAEQGCKSLFQVCRNFTLEAVVAAAMAPAEPAVLVAAALEETDRPLLQAVAEQLTQVVAVAVRLVTYRLF